MQVRERHIIMLQTSNGKIPFDVWYYKLDRLWQRAVDARITRVTAGNFGDHKSVGDELVILIGGGDKSTQRRDIEKAKQLWRSWKNES